MKFKNLQILLSALLIIFAGSCKKGSIETDYNLNLAVANNQVIAERAYSQVFNIFFMVVSDSILKAEGSNTVFGAQCTFQDDTAGIEYIIDYLPYYTPCPDGKKRKGVITASLDKDFHESGAIATLTFSDYGIDSLNLEGDNTISNTGMTMNMQPTFLHEVPSATLTFIYPTSHQSFHWSSEKMFIHAEGFGTSDFDDDVFDITGSATGSAVNGAVFSSTITEALGNYFNCRWIRTGISTLSIPGLDVKTGYINYIGEDTCTSQVIYYFNGNPFYDEFITH